MNMTEYIYLLQEREFIKTKENIYKLGKSRQENTARVKQYPKGSKLIIQLQCKNCDNTETALIKIFKESFKQRTDIGTEYFEGDKYEMCNIIYNYINNDVDYLEDTKYIESIITEDEISIEKIKKIFPNYKDDKLFGGNEYLIKINIDNDTIEVKYIYEFQCHCGWIDKYYLATHCFDRKLYNNCDYNLFEQNIEDGSIKNNSIYTFSTLLNKFNKHYKYLYTTIDSTVPNNIETIEIETITVLIESIVLRLNNENDHDIYDIMNRTLIPNIFSNCVIQNYEHFSGANIHCDLINNTLSIDDDYIQYMFDFEHKDKLDHFHSGVEIIIENNIYYEKITEIDDESDQDSN